MLWRWRNLNKQWERNNMTKKQNILVRLWTWLKNLSFWKKGLLLLIVVAVTVGGFFMWKSSGKKGSSSAQKYTTLPVKKADMQEVVASSGSLAPVSTTKVGALVSGEILKIYVDYNSQVKKGDLMAEFDMDMIRLAGLDNIVPIVIFNSTDYLLVNRFIGKKVKVGDDIMVLVKA